MCSHNTLLSKLARVYSLCATVGVFITQKVINRIAEALSSSLSKKDSYLVITARIMNLKMCVLFFGLIIITPTIIVYMCSVYICLIVMPMAAG